MSEVGRTWKLWAHRYESGKLWNVGAQSSVASGDGNIVALRITERQDAA